MIDLIKLLDDTHRKPITEFIRCNARLLQSAYATPSGRWTRIGGWWDRTVEGMNVAVALYPILDARRPHPFSLSDALVVLFMRDVEKPWELEDIDGKKMHRINMMTKDEQHIFRMDIAKRWGIPLSSDQLQAIQYSNDDHCDYTPQGVETRLAVFAYLCDYWCAEGWPDYPLEKNDPWKGAYRIVGKLAQDNVNEAEFLAKYKTKTVANE